MREIKFRAWDKKSKEFVDDFILDRLGNEYQFNKCEFWGDDRDIELTQYTGFKDKHGKEVYEGDRVLVLDESGNDDSGPVWFVPERMAYCIVWHEGESTFSLGDVKQTEIEVTGNIYENPELPQ